MKNRIKRQFDRAKSKNGQYGLLLVKEFYDL